MIDLPIRSSDEAMSGPRFAIFMFITFTIFFFILGFIPVIPNFGLFTPFFLVLLGFFSYFFPYRVFMDWLTHMFIFIGPIFVLSHLWNYNFFLAYLWFGLGFFAGLWAYQKKFI